MTNSQSIDYRMVLSDLKSKRSLLDKTINHIEGLIETGILNSTSLINIVSPIETGGSLANIGVYEATIRLLSEKGTTMKTQEILDELIKRGKTFDSKKPFTAVAATLYKTVKMKKDRCKIKLVGQGEWALNGI